MTLIRLFDVGTTQDLATVVFSASIMRLKQSGMVKLRLEPKEGATYFAAVS